ncbi:putative periplasmic protein [Candidatus Burkholderia humilis]|nr:putative periplasmic protein [Candidatus Burkholderia humilis]
MQNLLVTVSRPLFFVVIALSACGLIAGCKSTPANPPANTVTNDATGAPMSDAAIAARVKAAISTDADLRSLPVSVATYRGAVMLSGAVNSELQIQKAVAITRGVPGVQSVNHDLLVRPR